MTEMESDAGFATSPKPYMSSFTTVSFMRLDALDRLHLSTYSLWQTCLYAPFSFDLGQCPVPFVSWYLFVKIVVAVVAVAVVAAAVVVVVVDVPWYIYVCKREGER